MPQARSRLAIVIPVYNESAVIREVINSIPKKLKGISEIFIFAVNDGSTDNSSEEINKTRATLIEHPWNLGPGSATVTGLEAAKTIDADISITFDGDGQHSPSDIQPIIDPIINKKADLVIGTRMISREKMPWYKRIGNFGLNLITFILAGRWSNDSQSGFKAFSKNSLSKLDIDTLGYEFCSEIIIKASAAKLKVVEVPIKVKYSAHSKKKGQSIFNGVNIVAKLIFKKLTG